MTSAIDGPDEDTPSAAPATRPLLLPANYVARFYRGGSRLGAFRGQPAGEYDGEDWVGSTTAAYGATDGLGLSRLAGGGLLADAVEADPQGFLGAAHVAAFGTGTELLVKLLDAGERLAVHYHPTRGFAREHLGCAHGKTEAWLVLDAPPDAVVYLGFSREVPSEEVRGWVERQDGAAMLAALNRIPVGPGDAVLVPAGVPHAIGAGVFLVELQEPADWSLMLERDGYEVDSASSDWRLGLDLDLALSAVDRTAWTGDRLAALRLPAPVPLAPGVERLLPEAADPFFRAQSVTGPADLEPSFSVLVGTEGTLHLESETGHGVDLAAGQTYLLPFGTGHCHATGTGRAIRCLPPLPR
jgi:mannose-6-phosphate isomerase